MPTSATPIANLDGTVNALDFHELASNFGGAGKTWTQGDFNSDAITNTQDFTALAMNFEQTMASPGLATLVPEPVIGMVTALLVLSACQRRRHSPDQGTLSFRADSPV